MRTVLLAYPEDCIGCSNCEYACSFEHKRAFSPYLSRIKVVKNQSRQFFTPTFCRQCENAPCVTVCPTDALVNNRKTGVVEWDKEKCILCDVCIQTCPFGAITFVDEEVMKCDLCGGDPICVKFCPTEALRFIDEREAGKYKRECNLHKNFVALRERGE
jgi:Fe-S-cluster-containing hydrogenase component 2